MSGNTLVYYFDNDGKFISTIGAIGKGPGEYSYYNEIFLTNVDVIFQIGPNASLLHYDFAGNFMREEIAFSKPCGDFALHPMSGDYYAYTPLSDYLLYQIDANSLIPTDSLIANPLKQSAHLTALYPTLKGILLYNDPLDMRLNIYEIGDSLRLKYNLYYGLDPKAYNWDDGREGSSIRSENEIWYVRALLENSTWLYVCIRSQFDYDNSLDELYHLLYNKHTHKTYRLPGRFQDDSYFEFAFWLDEKNTLSITITPTHIADNQLWQEELKRRGINLQIDDNPIVVKIPLDRIF